MALLQNLRFALRLLCKSPAFTVTVLATLGLCIGANTAIYSIVDAVFFRPLPYPQPDRLVVIARKVSENGKTFPNIGQNGQAWERIRDHATLLTPAVYGESGGVNLYVNGQTAYIEQQRVGAGFFHVLGIPPLLGREWIRSEDVPGGPNLTVVSYNTWQHYFHGDPQVVGKTIDLRGAPYTVIGVMPRGFHTDDPAADLWTPLHPSPQGEGGGTNYEIIARLKPGVTLADATGQLTAIMKPIFAQYHLRPGRTMIEAAILLETGSTASTHTRILLMFSAVALVLLIGCINIAGLLLARAATRAREISTRMALGASRAAVISQLLTESLVLAIGGGFLGLLLGHYALNAFNNLTAHRFDIWNPVRLDARVGFVSFGAALVTGLVFGLFPALVTTRIDLRASLAEAGRGTAGLRHSWSRQALVFVEVTLGVTLVLAAGLLIRTLTGLLNFDPGFVSQNVTAASISLDDARYATTAAGIHLFRETLDRIRRIPGVESAAATLALPYARQLNSGLDRILGSKRTYTPQEQISNYDYVTPGFFGTLRVPLLRGRDFTDADGPNAQKVAIVNQAFVQHFMPGETNPLGAQIQNGNTLYTVVGVVQSVAQPGWDPSFGPIARVPELYIPFAQLPDNAFALVNQWFSPAFVVCTYHPVAGLPKAMDQAIAAVDPRLPFASFKNLNQVRAASLSEQRSAAALFSTLAALALLLAAIGLYGLVAQSVTQRTREMGIRLALGATPAHIVRNAAAPGILLAVAGVACGLFLSFFTARYLSSLLYGVSPTDRLTFTVVAIIFLAVAAMASLVPTLRLAKLDPAQTLRDE